jgi:hypothetical protein
VRIFDERFLELLAVELRVTELGEPLSVQAIELLGAAGKEIADSSESSGVADHE